MGLRRRPVLGGYVCGSAGAMLAAVCSLNADFALAQVGPGVTTDLRLRFAAGHSDNIQRRSALQESGSYRELGFVFDNVRQGVRLNTDFSGNVNFRNYSNPVIGDERIGSVNAFVGVDIVPQIFSWSFNDTYGQGRVDPFQVSSPTNRQEINFFSTGPTIDLPIGERSLLSFSGTETRRRYDNTANLDSDSRDLELRITRAVNAATDLSIGFVSNDITYDNNPLLSWKVDTVFISYDRQLARGSAMVRLGDSTIDLGVIEQSSPLIDIAWSREVGARSSIVVTANKTQGDPSNSFLSANNVRNVGAIGANNAFLGPGVYESTELGVTSTTTFDRTRFSVTVGVGESNYVRNIAFNSDQQRLSFDVVRDLSPRLQMGLSNSVFERDFAARPTTTDIDRNTRLWLTKSFARRFSLDFSYSRWSRDSQGLTPFEENIYLISLTLDLT